MTAWKVLNGKSWKDFLNFNGRESKEVIDTKNGIQQILADC